MQVATELSEADWKIANDMANHLATTRTDHNELRKSLTYLLSIREKEDVCEQFSTYLMILATDEDVAKRSEQNNFYHRSIYEAYHDYLKRYEDQPDRMIQIFGWVSRLIRYYETANYKKNNQQSKYNRSKPRSKNRNVYRDKTPTGNSQPSVVTVKNIKKSKVTYKISLFTINQEEPQLAAKLKKGKSYPAQLIENPDGTRSVRILGGF